ncbi:CPLN1 protein, partial [Bucco capensis]|nr:CPLN1 protein [Bucco capensis]
NAVISLSDGEPSQTIVSPMSSAASSTSICAKKQEVKEEVTAEEDISTSETLKKMVQDEVLKLVQLQQINFMSLMQTVQSSFANLPNLQHVLEQHQSVPLGGSEHAHPAEGNGSVETK